MKNIGLATIKMKEELIENTVNGLKRILGKDYEFKIYDLESSGHVLEECFKKSDIPILLIDAENDGEVYYRTPIVESFKLSNGKPPIFMFLNFEDLDDKELPYVYNTIVDNSSFSGKVENADDLKYHTIFYSPKKEIAFSSVLQSYVKDCTILKKLLKNYWFNYNSQPRYKYAWVFFCLTVNIN